MNEWKNDLQMHICKKANICKTVKLSNKQTGKKIFLTNLCLDKSADSICNQWL